MPRKRKSEVSMQAAAALGPIERRPPIDGEQRFYDEYGHPLECTRSGRPVCPDCGKHDRMLTPGECFRPTDMQRVSGGVDADAVECPQNAAFCRQCRKPWHNATLIKTPIPRPTPLGIGEVRTFYDGYGTPLPANDAGRPLCPCCRQLDRVLLPGETHTPKSGASYPVKDDAYCTRCSRHLRALYLDPTRPLPDFLSPGEHESASVS